jgi:hypothetical protein
MYASIMVFGSHNKFKSNYENIAWHPDNNVNDMRFKECDSFFKPTPHGLYVQRLLVKKLVDTLNDFDNIIFEVMNEASFPQSSQWQKKIVIYAKQYEKQKAKQHLWGITAGRHNANPSLISGPHDWWSPDTSKVEGYDYRKGGPASYTAKPVIVDSDHFGKGLYKASEISKGIDLVWKTFTRGNHPILMECYDDNWAGPEFGCNNEINHVFDPIRKALGHTRAYAARFTDLSITKPSEIICSTRYCMVNPGEDYIIYLPMHQEKRHASRLLSGIKKLAKMLGYEESQFKAKSFTVNLKKGRYKLEWFDPCDESLSVDSIQVYSEGRLKFSPPPSHQRRCCSVSEAAKRKNAKLECRYFIT